ncbi:calmodulin binding protein PICBP-like [Hordeum vulgare subsp. vulgare]|uniref:Calmodulin-binding domain-containing protein n=1 Tax=Hordeum vulgare subsp. vulgare TaxID=112509 RepID=A0A8I6XU50_HORVV|nr:calmodulin binding protein PICBP-like [Hordeum vulgare subsp. vulgare]
MVHCKQPRRRPGDPAGGVRTTGGRARAGGGAPPGYMRPTSSSGSRTGREFAAATPSAPAAQPVVPKEAALGGGTPLAARPTCSSAQKSARARDLCGGGGEGRRACRYAYCSYKGHAPAPPPLGAFLASRRGLVKTEQSMKHRGVSAFRSTNTNPNPNPSSFNAAGKGDGFFLQVACPGAGARPKTASSGSCCSGLSAEEVDSPYVNFGPRGLRGGTDTWGASVDGSCGSSDVISDGFADLPATATSPSPSTGRKEGNRQDDQEAAEEKEEEDSAACCRSDISEELGPRYQANNNMSKDCGGSSVDSSMDDISSAFAGMNFQDVGADPTADGAATSQGNRLTMSRRRTPRGGERIRAFNPRAPNFLPVVPDPDAEKVDLRHQMADDRKNAEEWMVDYALRRTVNKLARAQKRKVEMLVQAFETVLPPPPVPGEKNYLQDDHKKSLARCN